ncbi:hypothetical protein Mal15_46030 [Stieleria maiorica]|uniref:Uncharacterized protein n=1 Tax=Stieleria maiorica TaxID=2795974 RepID=A0A5B9MGX2_9BACT|nr:hypothetical protein [Stieleria maiorica]QEG00533.1 hypothetical protein Mal15_46030 [Stieleria maiorica]
MFRSMIATAALLTAFSTLASGQTIQFEPGTGMVTVNGTNGPDECEIKMAGDEVRVELKYPDPDGSGTDKIREYFEVHEINFIVFLGFDGDDLCYFDDIDEFYDEGASHIVSVQYGGKGADMLFGGPASDYLDGGEDAQVDVLMGGPGNDTFVRYYRKKKVDADYGTLASATDNKAKQVQSKSSLLGGSSSQVKLINVPLVDKIVDFNSHESDFIDWVLVQ